MKPKHYKPQYAVAQTVADMQRKFVYPDVDTKPGPPFIGGGGGAPTIVIAASDATDVSKGKADYVCTGVNDHEVISAALLQMDIGTGLGGRLLFTEGTFHCAYGQIRAADNTAQSPVHFQGMGKATILSFESGTGIAIELNSDDCTVSDLWILGNDINGVVGIHMDDGEQLVTGVMIERLGTGSAIHVGTPSTSAIIANCTIEDCTGDGILLESADETAIIGNHIDVNGAGVIGDGVNISIVSNQFVGPQGFAVDNTGDSDWLIEGNEFIATNGVRFGTNANNCAVIGNRFDTGGQVLFTAAVSGCKVSGNIWDIAQAPSVDGVVVFNVGATDCQITDNLIQDAGGMDAIRVETGLDVLIANNLIGEGADIGIVVNSGTRVHVEGNTVKFAGEHGIDYDGSDGSVVDNLVFGSSQNLTNTFDNINLSGNANLCQGNHSLPALIAPLTRYGINIVSGNDNAVYANALGDSSVYGTADSVNSGTGTQVTPAAGVIGGQFAY